MTPRVTTSDFRGLIFVVWSPTLPSVRSSLPHTPSGNFSRLHLQESGCSRGLVGGGMWRGGEGGAHDMLWDLTGVPLGTVVLPSNVDFFARPRTTFLSFGGEFHGIFFPVLRWTNDSFNPPPPSLSSFPSFVPFSRESPDPNLSSASRLSDWRQTGLGYDRSHHTDGRADSYRSCFARAAPHLQPP